MDTSGRTLAKSITWQLMGLVMTTLIGFAVTGSFAAGGAVAAMGAAVGFAGYAAHERAWDRVRWGRRAV